MNEHTIIKYICENFSDVMPVEAWGETSFFYNPKQALPRGVYFATLKLKDGNNDKASNLNRISVFRLNIGISKLSYHSHFGKPPTRPSAGGIVDTGHDFTLLDTLLPHPVYGWMSWVCILNPSPTTFETIKPLLTEAYGLAAAKFHKRVK